MKKIKIMKLAVFTLATILIQSTSNAQSKKDHLIDGLKNSKIFKESIFENYKHIEKYKPSNIKAKLLPEFMIRFESQVGISIRPKLVDSNHYAEIINEQLYVVATAGKNYLQIGEHDFDGDMNSEIVVCFGVKGVEFTCSVYKFIEPVNISQSNKIENWKKLGSFEYYWHDLKHTAYVKKDKIYFPFGYQGAFGIHELRGEKFIKLENY